MYDQLLGLPNYYTTGYFWLTTSLLAAGFILAFYAPDAQEYGWRYLFETLKEIFRKKVERCSCGFHKARR